MKNRNYKDFNFQSKEFVEFVDSVKRTTDVLVREFSKIGNAMREALYNNENLRRELERYSKKERSRKRYERTVNRKKK